MGKQAKVPSSDAAAVRDAHAELDRRVKELDKRAILTPAEQHERAELKKKKLALKDQLGH